jgi:hypothetical protein
MATKGNFYILVGVRFLGGGVAPPSSRHWFSCTPYLNLSRVLFLNLGNVLGVYLWAGCFHDCNA